MKAEPGGKRTKRPQTPALEVSGLKLHVGQRLILKDIDVCLPKGELIGVLGPNGAGKTTFLKAVTGFLPVSQGQVRIFGKDLGSMSQMERARAIALLPQDLDVPFPFSVEEIVAMGRYCRMEKGRETAGRVKAALCSCRIEHLAHRSFASLSGGERRLVLLARCLCQDSPLFLLDEATSSLDIRRKLEVFELLRREVRDKGRTVVIVIHDINLASLYLDRLLFLKDGSVVGQGAVDEIVYSDYLSEVFETRTIVMKHPECSRPVVLFSPPGSRPSA